MKEIYIRRSSGRVNEEIEERTSVAQSISMNIRERTSERLALKS